MNIMFKVTKMSRTEISTIKNRDSRRTTISVSRKNFLTLKKLGYVSESDSMDEVISKILAKQTGVYKINV